MTRGVRRRLRGEGSTWKRTDGRYGFAVYVKGIKRQGTAATKADALAEVRRLQGAGAVASGKGTFGEFLAEWLQEVRIGKRPKTFESYEAVVRLYLIPACGRVRLSKLEAKHVTNAVAMAARRTRKKPKAGEQPAPEVLAPLSSSALAYIRTVARIALERALELGKVTTNVAKMSAPVKVERVEQQPMTDEEFARYLAAIDGNRLEVAFFLAALMGMRKGEILGLTWDAVVERGDTIELRIYQQLQRVARRLVVVPVKTKRSRRVITLPAGLAEALRRHRAAQKAEQLRAGEGWQGTGHVFTTRTGGLIDPRNLLEYHYDKLSKVKLPRRSFHAMRHEAATSMLAAGVPLKGISQLLGHSSERFTSEVYAHMVPAIEQQVTAAAEARMKKR